MTTATVTGDHTLRAWSQVMATNDGQIKTKQGAYKEAENLRGDLKCIISNR